MKTLTAINTLPGSLPRLLDITKKGPVFVGGPLGAKPYHLTKLLSDGDSNPKTAKNLCETALLQLAADRSAGVGNMCPFADVCAESCLTHSGRGDTSTVIRARVGRTLAFHMCRDWFLRRLELEVAQCELEARFVGSDLACRLNAFSDYPWETSTGIIDSFPRVRWYDYTKNPKRWGWVRPNYYLCFSLSRDNRLDALNILSAGGSVSVVFYDDDGRCGKAAHRQTLPNEITLGGVRFPVFDGSKTDLRDEDPPGHVVGLRLLAKDYRHRNLAIRSGFAVRCNGSTVVEIPLAGVSS